GRLFQFNEIVYGNQFSRLRTNMNVSQVSGILAKISFHLTQDLVLLAVSGEITQAQVTEGHLQASGYIGYGTPGGGSLGPVYGDGELRLVELQVHVSALKHGTAIDFIHKPGKRFGQGRKVHMLDNIDDGI